PGGEGAERGTEAPRDDERGADLPDDHRDRDPDRDRHAPAEDGGVEEQEARREDDDERLRRGADGELDQDQPEDEARGGRGKLRLRTTRMLEEFRSCGFS